MSALKKRCVELSAQGYIPREIGRILGLHRTTVIWHLGKIDKSKMAGAAEKERIRKANIKKGVHVPEKKLFVKKGDYSVVYFHKDKKERYRRTVGTKSRVKGLDGKFYYWCDYCLSKIPWDEYLKSDRKCLECEKAPLGEGQGG